MHRRLVVLIAAIAAVLALPSAASACSRDDQAYFDSFPDASCLLERTNTEIDTFGGLRLVTDGALGAPGVWDTQAHFETGITYLGQSFAPVGTSTLAVNTTPPVSLELPNTPLALTPSEAPVLGPRTPSVAPDSDHVDDPSVVKDGSTYVMFYAGVAEDGTGPAIFRLESTDGVAWRQATPLQVLTGSSEDGAIDEHGVSGPHVLLDPSDSAAPWKMWFTARGDFFSQVGYATSTDGKAWTKYDSADAGTLPDAALAVGLPGSRDAFAASNPSVLKDGAVYKMWYEGDDSTKRSIGYATSTDGKTWNKGGAVIVAGSGNTEFGVFAPHVWKDGATFRMVLGARKSTGNVNDPAIKTLILGSDSPNGVTGWSSPSGNVAVPNPNTWASTDLNSPFILFDAGGVRKLYFSGSSVSSGDPHTRIGLTSSSGGGGWQEHPSNPILDVGAAGPKFDSRQASGLSVVDVRPAVAGEYAGVYWGRGGTAALRKPRLGAAQSEDGVAWSKLAGPQTGNDALLALGANNDFDENGQRDPSLLYSQNGSGADDWFLFFTGLAADGTRRIGFSATTETAVTLLPQHAAWSNPPAAAQFGLGTTFDDGGLEHPSAIVDGAAFTLYYGAIDATGGTRTIGRASANTIAQLPAATRAAVSFTGTATCDPGGAKDPVVWRPAAATYRMLYVGLAPGGVERLCFATSTDGTSWARQGIVLDQSLTPYAFDEAGVSPSGVLQDASTIQVFTTGTDRTGRTRGGRATASTVTPAGKAPRGSATYQMGTRTLAPRDFRSIARTSSDQGVLLEMSVLQPYSVEEQEDIWSAFFPVTRQGAIEELNFDLGVRGVRWRARLTNAQTPAPSLDKVQIDHADISFAAAGSAKTVDIAPPDTLGIVAWSSLVVDSTIFQPVGSGAGTGTVSVLSTGDQVLLGPTALTFAADQTIPLTINVADHPKLRVKLDLASDQAGLASPLVRSIKLSYTSTQATPTPTPTPTPVPPPPPPPAVLTLTAVPAKVVFGRTAVVSGRLSVGAAGVAGRVVKVLAQPVGTTAPKPLGTATTDPTGAYKLTVKPNRHTTYSVATPGVTSPAAVTVKVAHRLSLRVKLSGRRAAFSGALGPKHARRYVTLQRKSGTKWVRVVRVRTTRTSTFRMSRTLTKGRHQFRVVTVADKQHLAGRSVVKRVRVS